MNPSREGRPDVPQSKPQALHAPWRLSYLEMLGAAERETAGSRADKSAHTAAPGSRAADPGAGDAPESKPNCFLREYWLNPGADEKNHIIVRTGLPHATAPAPSPSGRERGEGSATRSVTPQTLISSPSPAASPAQTAPRGGLILLNRYPYANGHLLVCLGEGRPRLLDYDEAQRAELWSLVDLATELCERTLRCQGVNIGLNQGLAAGAGVPEHVHVHVVPRWFGDVNFISVVGQVRVIPGALEEMAKRYRDVWAEVRHERGL